MLEEIIDQGHLGKLSLQVTKPPKIKNSSNQITHLPEEYTGVPSYLQDYRSGPPPHGQPKPQTWANACPCSPG